jgi:hypothetical protein
MSKLPCSIADEANEFAIGAAAMFCLTDETLKFSFLRTTNSTAH